MAFVFFLCAAFAIYGPVLNGELIWDDAYLVGENPFFRSPVFIWEVFRHYLFFDSFSTYYRPIQNWSYMLDYWLWRGEPIGYHITNVLLHALSALLVWRLFRRLLPPLLARVADARLRVAGPGIAWAVAAVWLVHPMHNAAVAYISGRADSLASLFALAAWLATLRLDEARGLRRVLLAVGAAVSMLLALCSKEIALVWLGLFVLHLLFFTRDRPWRMRGALLTGALAVFACYAWLHSLPAPRTGAGPAVWEPLPARLLLVLRALGDYTSIIFAPARLTMDRSLSTLATYRGGGWWLAHLRLEYLPVIGGLALAACAYACTRGSARRLLLFAACWFVIAFLPISNLFPLNAEVAEHWIYLASIGYLLFLAVALAPVAFRWPRLAAGLGFAALLALGVRTGFRAHEWADQERFLKATIAAGGGSPRVLNNLGTLYANRGDLIRQEDVLRRTLVLFPDYAPARINLGINLTRQKRTKEAEPLLSYDLDATRLNASTARQTWRSATNLAHTASESGKTGEALDIVQGAQREFSGVWELVGMEAAIRRKNEGPAAVVPIIEKFAQAHWWHRESWLSLARVCAEAGDSDRACAAFTHASRLDIYDARPLAGLARVEFARQRGDAAIFAQRQAITRAPDHPSHYLDLSRMLEQLGRTDESAAAVRKAHQLTALAP